MDDQRYNLFSFGSSFDGLDSYSQFLQPFIDCRLVILCADLDFYVPRRKHLRVQVFHGLVSFGSVWGDNFFHRFDVLFLTGPYMNRQLQQAHYKTLLAENGVRVHRIGYPKLDLFNDLEATTDAKYLFYGPTYHVKFSSIFGWLDIIFEIASSKGLSLIIKLHPYLYSHRNIEYSGGINWDDKIEDLANTHGVEVKLLSGSSSIHDHREAFSLSRLFVTDVSGIGYEYMLATGNPVIFLDDKIKIPIGSNKQRFRNHFEISKRGVVGPVVFNREQLDKEIDLLTKTNRFEKEIKRLRREFVYNLGNAGSAAQRALEFEYSIIEEIGTFE